MKGEILFPSAYLWVRIIKATFQCTYGITCGHTKVYNLWSKFEPFSNFDMDQHNILLGNGSNKLRTSRKYEQ